MMPAKFLNAPRGGDCRPARLRSILLAGAVHFSLSTVAFAGGEGEGLVIRSGEAELRLTSPREVGKIPVVLVHGMFGRPGNWSVMIDRLAADPSVRERFQFLTFGYDSLQSIPESGRELLDALTEARRRFDPDGRDGSFDRVILVGHSLGGLVAKVAAIRATGPQPGGPVRSSTPRLGRVIFVATPHRGAPVDRGLVRSVGAGLARTFSPSIGARRRHDDPASPPATSVDQLTWDHPLLQDLERAGAAAGVPFHSIIAALREPSAEGATDGLVPVASARLENVRSEFVVRTHHICLQHPEVIGEVRRVLDEHAAEPDQPPRPGPGGAPPVGSLGALSIPQVPPRALAALPRSASPDDASRPIHPGVVPAYGTP
jgi:pimeloyl-ACP methyl ester carboxylesterase